MDDDDDDGDARRPKEVFALWCYVRKHWFSAERAAQLEKRTVLLRGQRVIRVHADDHNPMLSKPRADRPHDFDEDRTSPGLAQRLQSLRNDMKTESEKKGEKRYESWSWLLMDLNGVPHMWVKPGFSLTTGEWKNAAYFRKVPEEERHPDWVGTPHVSIAHIKSVNRVVELLQRGPVTIRERCSYHGCPGTSRTVDYSGDGYHIELEKTVEWAVDGVPTSFRLDVAVTTADDHDEVVDVAEIQKTCPNTPGKMTAFTQNHVQNAQLRTTDITDVYKAAIERPEAPVVFSHCAPGHAVAHIQYCNGCAPLAQAEADAQLQAANLAAKERQGSLLLTAAKDDFDEAFQVAASAEELQVLVAAVERLIEEHNATQHGRQQQQHMRDLRVMQCKVADVKAFERGVEKVNEGLDCARCQIHTAALGRAARTVTATRAALERLEERCNLWVNAEPYNATVTYRLSTLKADLQHVSDRVDECEAAALHRKRRREDLTTTYGKLEVGKWLRGHLRQALCDSVFANASDVVAAAVEPLLLLLDPSASSDGRLDASRRYAEAITDQGSFPDVRNPLALAAYALATDGPIAETSAVLRLSATPSSSHGPAPECEFVCASREVWDAVSGTVDLSQSVLLRVQTQVYKGIRFLRVDESAQVYQGGGGDAVDAEERYEAARA